MTPKALYERDRRDRDLPMVPWRWLEPRQQETWRIRAEARFGKPENARRVVFDFLCKAWEG